jgi:hypothetical protein
MQAEGTLAAPVTRLRGELILFSISFLGVDRLIGSLQDGKKLVNEHKSNEQNQERGQYSNHRVNHSTSSFYSFKTYKLSQKS